MIYGDFGVNYGYVMLVIHDLSVFMSFFFLFEGKCSYELNVIISIKLGDL